MSRYIDLTDQRFQDVEVLSYQKSVNGRSLWLCLCHKCGETCIRSRRFLLSRSEDHPDCGCTYQAEKKIKCRDLSGELFGNIQVLYPAENTGEKYKRSKLYMCKCMVCGNQRVIPSMEIKSNMASCGCQRYQSEEMQRRAKLGVAVNVKDGVQVSLLKREQANKNSKTGVRGVYLLKNGTYQCSVQIAGRKRTKKGFLSVATAKAARDQLKADMIAEFGLDPTVLSERTKSISTP